MIQRFRPAVAVAGIMMTMIIHSVMNFSCIAVAVLPMHASYTCKARSVRQYRQSRRRTKGNEQRLIQNSSREGQVENCDLIEEEH
jgi:hypothetical protein